MYHPVLFINPIFILGLIFLIAWSIVWKGFALWRASKDDSAAWFIVLLVVNTLGILDILYLFIFSKNSKNKQKKGKIRR